MRILGKIKVKDGLLIKKKYGAKILPSWIVNKNTPRGEPVDYYEETRYDGRKYINHKNILGFIKNSKLEIYNCNMSKNRLNLILNFCKKVNLEISDDLFFNGERYTTIKDPFKGFE